MNNYDLTILYARHGEERDKPKEFPAQVGLPEKIQLISVWEDDIFSPRKKSLDFIRQAEGTFTIMLDEGDKFAPDFLKKMIDAMSRPDIACSMPSCTFQKVRRTTEYFSTREAEDELIDTTVNTTVFPMELHGLMLRTEFLKEAFSQISFPAEPEKQILLYMFRKWPRFHYLGTCCLAYAQPREYDPEYDLRCHTRAWYYEPFEQFLLPLFEAGNNTQFSNELLPFTALHMMYIRVLANKNNKNKHIISPEDALQYAELFTRVLQFVDEKAILQPDTICYPAKSSVSRKLFFLRLKKQDFSYYPTLQYTDETTLFLCDKITLGSLSSLPLRLIRLDYNDGALEIDGEHIDLFAPQDAEVFAKCGEKYYALTYNQRYAMTKYFGVTAFRMKTFHVSIPAATGSHERLLQFVFRSQGHEYVLEYNFPSHGSRFAKDFGYAYWRFGKYLSYWKKDGIHIVESKKWMVLKKELGLWLQMWKKKNGFYRNQLPIKILNFLLRPYFSRQKIWLFIDKIYKGGDSSEYMYRYAAKQRDGIKKYYLLDKSSSDYIRMKKEGYHPLVRGSLKHRLVFLNADIVIASNSTVFAFNDYSFERSLPIRSDVHFDVACVQHGMSVQKIAIAQQRLRDNTRLYFCASKYEIENLSKPVYDYTGYDALKLTGVPRYDGLINRAQKILVISPTWRMQSALPVTRNEGVSRDYNPNFKETSYYKVYNGLINDPRLLSAARKYGYRIQYVLHPIVSPQHDDFEKNDLVEIIPSIGDMSYEKIFCEGALMVTDFSGVQFDFAYMRKPVIYLHHRDIPQHYEEGTFFYETMGFGEICRTNDELIDVLCTYMKNDCVMPDLYRRRADDFFEFSDNRNCERIYPIMLEYQRMKNRK